MYTVLRSPDAEPFEKVRLKVGGESVFAEKVLVSKLPFNIPWKGFQRAKSQTEASGFIRILSDEPVQIEAEVDFPVERAVVRPRSKGVLLQKEGGRYAFTLSQGQYSLEFNDEHTAVCIFVDKPRDFQEYGKPTLYFGAGVHEVGRVTLEEGDRVFVDEGARVYGEFYAKGERDIRIYGYGVIDGGKEERNSPNCYGEDPNGCLKFYECEGITVDGVTLVDSAVWVVNLFACKDVVIDGVKIVGHWKYNTDGIDVVNSADVAIKNSFIRAFDDVITLKGILPYRHLPVENITVENCVLWCGWGRTLEIGLETLAPYYRNITFRNCDLIHNSAVAIDVQSGDYAEIYDIFYEDLRVEYQTSTLPEQMEEPIGCEYRGYGKLHVPTLIKICTWEYYLGKEFTDYDKALRKARKGKVSVMHDLLFKNITAFVESREISPPTVIDVKAPHRVERVIMQDIRTVFEEE